MMTTFTLEKVLSDARSLVSRLKEQENTADSLVTQTQELSKKVDSMKMYQENLSALTEMARQRPHAQLTIGIFQENSEISELDQENVELRQALDEHQSAIELIMSRYRDQIQHLVAANRTDRARYSSSPDHSQDVQEKVDQIYKMADVMWSAMTTDNDRVAIEAQQLAQLRVENETLRDLLTAGRHSLASSVTSRHIQTDCPPVAPHESTQTQCVTPDSHVQRSRCESEQSDDTSLNNTTVFETSTLKRAAGPSPGGACNEAAPQGPSPGGACNEAASQGHSPGNACNEAASQGHSPGGTCNEAAPGHSPSSTCNEAAPQGHSPGSACNEAASQGHSPGGTCNEAAPQGHSPGGTCNEVAPLRSNGVAVVDVDLSEVTMSKTSTSDGAKPQTSMDRHTSSDASQEHETTTSVSQPSSDDVISVNMTSHETCESTEHIAAVDLCDISVSCSAVDAVSLSATVGNTDGDNITQTDDSQLLTAGETVNTETQQSQST